MQIKVDCGPLGAAAISSNNARQNILHCATSRLRFQLHAPAPLLVILVDYLSPFKHVGRTKRTEAPMRKRSICLISVLALAGCAKANAATVDPNSDYDCAFTFRFWGGLAKIQGASDKTRQGLFVFEEWYIDKWEAEHPNAPDPRSHGREILNALAVDPVMSKQAIMTCTDRAAADPAFNRFATLLSKKMPDAR